MLGKVFENMLEVTERRSKGACYTPREIVHYMCQESLIHKVCDPTIGSGAFPVGLLHEIVHARLALAPTAAVP